jgi:hypothetical protein
MSYLALKKANQRKKFIENNGLCLRFTPIHGKSLSNFSCPRKAGKTVISFGGHRLKPTLFLVCNEWLLVRINYFDQLLF